MEKHRSTLVPFIPSIPGGWRTSHFLGLHIHLGYIPVPVADDGWVTSLSNSDICLFADSYRSVRTPPTSIYGDFFALTRCQNMLLDAVSSSTKSTGCDSQGDSSIGPERRQRPSGPSEPPRSLRRPKCGVLFAIPRLYTGRDVLWSCPPNSGQMRISCCF